MNKNIAVNYIINRKNGIYTRKMYIKLVNSQQIPIEVHTYISVSNDSSCCLHRFVHSYIVQQYD